MTSAFDTQLFTQYDQKVDESVENWMKKGDFKKIMASLHLQNKDENLPEDFIAFKNSLKIIPEWLDEELIEAGCQLSERSGLNGLLILRNFALLGGYNFANLTKPLVATGSLEKGAVHRLYNTLNFWVEVSRTSENAQGMRVNACIRTRLIHSAYRLMIDKSKSNWNGERYGIPINYADMVATNIAFTVYFLYGLNQLNFKYSEKEALGIFHLWKYVTYLLGVPVEIIPNNTFEALDFFHFWTKYLV